MSFPPGFEHAKGFFERLSVQAVQNHVVVAQDIFESSFL